MSTCNRKYSGEKTILLPKIYNMMSFTVLLQLNISIYFMYILIYIIHIYIYNRERVQNIQLKVFGNCILSKPTYSKF